MANIECKNLKLKNSTYFCKIENDKIANNIKP